MSGSILEADLLTLHLETLPEPGAAAAMLAVGFTMTLLARRRSERTA
jgi:hypothetical protein